MRIKLPDAVGRVLLSVFALSVGCDGADSQADHDGSPGPLPQDSSTIDGGDASTVSPMLDSGRDALIDAGALDRGDAAADAEVPTDSCDVSAPTECPTPAPTYETVAPIFAQRCVICHAGNWNGPWPLNSYRHVADWKDDIRTNLLACTMPPLEARVPMTRAERLTILTWIRCNIPM
jgi:hypothetical protein